MGDILDSAVSDSQSSGATTPVSSPPILDSLVIPPVTSDVSTNPTAAISDSMGPPSDPIPQPVVAMPVAPLAQPVTSVAMPSEPVSPPMQSPLESIPQPIQSAPPMSDSIPPDASGSLPPADTSGSGDTFNGKPKKKIGGTFIIIGMLLLLIALPVGVYYISQSQSLNDIRNRASTYPVDPNFPCSTSSNNCPAGTQCHCQGGDACTSTKCEPIETSCNNQGRSWCVNMTGKGYTCCVAGYTCCDTVNGCCGGGNTPRPTDDNPPPEDSPTPTVPMSTNTTTHTPTNTPVITNTVTDTPTHTPTNTVTQTPTATPTSTVGCNETCTVNTDCNSGTVCADGRCRNPQCTQASTCQCATNTNTPTPSPTPIAFVGCNSACTVNTDCSSGLVCIDSFCRNPSCTDKTSCQCDVAQATPQTPVAGTGPSVMGASIIAGGFLLVLLGLAL